MAGWCFNGDWQNIKREHLHMPICDLINAFNERWKFRYWTWSDETAGYTFGTSIGAALLRPTYSDFYNLRIEHLYNLIREIQANMWRLFPGMVGSMHSPYNIANRYTQALHWVRLDAWKNSTFTPAVAPQWLCVDYDAFGDPHGLLSSNRTDNSYPLMQLKEILGNMRYYGCDALSRCIATTDTPSNRYDYTLRGVSMMQDSHGNDAIDASPETRHYKGLLNDTITPSGSSAPYEPHDGGYKVQAHPSYSDDDAGSWMSVPDPYSLYPRLYYTAAHTMTSAANINAWVDAITAGPTLPSQFYTVVFPNRELPLRAVGFRNGDYRWLAQPVPIPHVYFGTPPELHTVYYYYANTYEAGVYANDLTLSFIPEFVIAHKHIMTRVNAVGHAERMVLGYDNPHLPESVQFDVAGTNITLNKPAGDELRVLTNHEIEFPGPSAFPGYGDNEINVTMHLEEGDIDYFYGIARERVTMQLSSVHTYWDATEALDYYNDDYE